MKEIKTKEKKKEISARCKQERIFKKWQISPLKLTSNTMDKYFMITCGNKCS